MNEYLYVVQDVLQAEVRGTNVKGTGLPQTNALPNADF